MLALSKSPQKSVLPPPGECNTLVWSRDKCAIIPCQPCCNVPWSIFELLWPHFSNILSSWNDDLEHIVHMFPPMDDQKQQHFISNFEFNKSHCSLNALQCQILSTFFSLFFFASLSSRCFSASLLQPHPPAARHERLPPTRARTRPVALLLSPQLEFSLKDSIQIACSMFWTVLKCVRVNSLKAHAKCMCRNFHGWSRRRRCDGWAAPGLQTPVTY